MAKFPEAEVRNFHRVFVCKNCKSKIRAPVLKVADNKISCRKCGAKTLRPIRKK